MTKEAERGDLSPFFFLKEKGYNITGVYLDASAEQMQQAAEKIGVPVTILKSLGKQYKVGAHSLITLEEGLVLVQVDIDSAKQLTRFWEAVGEIRQD